jgi:hypothetical protein
VFIYVLAGGAILALLVWAGRRPARVSNWGRVLSALLGALAAVAAVASALRGGWIPSLVLIGCSVLLGRTARVARPEPQDGNVANPMSAAEARELLGVGETADRDEIAAAYRRLMRVAHPDHGGSTGLAMKLNAARDRLLGKRPGL